jgi:hypothetical protein
MKHKCIRRKISYCLKKKSIHLYAILENLHLVGGSRFRQGCLRRYFTYMLLTRMFCLTTDPETKEPNDHGMKF